MSQRRKTAPPTHNASRSSTSDRKGLIAKTKNQSAKRRTVLDDRFHRTYHAFSCERPHLPAAERHGGCRHLTTTRSAAAVTPCKQEMRQALQRRASERPLVGCYAELGRRELEPRNR